MAAAALSSRLKVKLPGMTSTMSGNLPVILLGVTQLGLLGSLLVAMTAAFAQSYAPGRKSKVRFDAAKQGRYLLNILICRLTFRCGR
jgi:hypothetical protein